ncbi:hypothetical protein B0A52_01803 [Exophiala mesophila]|uniref:NTF2 domain-containing protein n=1 Tax=Exophiala mesophila TaxID=212818 RepID=A0A438NG36_EXOME|nr:hypothetical protein B0A52_01803 [Exophiala mesophila]
MANDAAPVNGLYANNQFSQPAELAASTPSAPAHAPSASQSTTTSTSAQKTDAQEIGWYFVEQYYTTLSKSPEKIHLFYSKKSQLVSGVEADKVVPAVGSKAISDKIKTLDFHECKVRVLNVDSQSSFSNIVVQVIGEMSNKSEPHHKFVQTFVLAEQPNGYFVLNDIFRYLKDEEDEIVEDEQTQEEIPAEEPPTPLDGPAAAEPEVKEAVTTQTAAEQVDEKLEKQEVPSAVGTEVNGASVPAEVEQPASTDEVPQESTKDADVVAAPVAPSEQKVEDTAAPVAPAETTPAPEAPPAKKTWASMLGGGAKAPAVPALPATTTTTSTKAARPAQPAQPAKTSSEASPAPAVSDAGAASVAQSNGWQTADHGKKAKPQNKPEEITLAYIKNVTDKVDGEALRKALERYGEIKYFDISKQRNCAFAEFSNPAGYAAASAANPHKIGTELVYVEERRPRPDAYGGANTAFARGGGRNTPRGGGRGGNFAKDGGRGNFQARGGKPGNVTPKGRGQASTA